MATLGADRTPEHSGLGAVVRGRRAGGQVGRVWKEGAPGAGEPAEGPVGGRDAFQEGAGTGRGRMESADGSGGPAGALDVPRGRALGGAALSCLQVTLQGDEAGVWSGTCILHYIKKKKNCTTQH